MKNIRKRWLNSSTGLLMLMFVISGQKIILSDVEIYHTSYLVRARVYSSNSTQTVYIQYPENKFKIVKNDSAYLRLPDGFIENVKDYGFNITKTNLLISDSISKIIYNDTLLTLFFIGKMINVEKVDSIVSDTALFGDWGGIKPWVDSLTGDRLSKNKVLFSDTIWIENGGYQFLHVIGIDSSWSKEKYRKHINEDIFQSFEAQTHREIIAAFDPIIRKALTEKKLFFYTTWSP